MQSWITRVPRPVRRAGAQRYLLMTLLSFAASVILTRAFLALTGYPQIGGATLHIAHLLWGGLLLFAAALLPLIFANRWIYAATGVLSGAGAGLFIDEVGKFITRTHDYFYPPAAPIIYAFFLMVVLLYARVRHIPSRDARSELYIAFEGLQEVLDHDLSESEQVELERTLLNVAKTAEQPEFRSLATVLLTYLKSSTVSTVPDRRGFRQVTLARLQQLEDRWIDRRLYRALLVAALLILGLSALAGLASSVVVAALPWLPGVTDAAEALGGHEMQAGGPFWFTVRLVLEAVVGLTLLVAVRELLARHERRGTALGYYGLLISLTTINLLAFYFDQFRAVFSTLVQFGVLLAIGYYRQRYLHENP